MFIMHFTYNSDESPPEGVRPLYMPSITMDANMSANGSHLVEGANITLPEPPYWNLPTTVILSTTIIIIMAFALVGNILVISVILRHRGMRTRTNMFLCNLAVTDFLCALLNMPVSLVTVVKGQWMFGEFEGWFCQINGFVMPLLFVTSIHTLMYISIHKYVSITRPFSRILTHRRIFYMILAAWFWAALSAYVTVHGLNKVIYKPFTTQCGPDYPKDLRTYMLPLYITSTCYLIPFFVIVFCYWRMFREIRAHSLRMEKHTNQEPDVIFLQQKRIAFTLLVVLVTFALTWTPYIMYSVYVTTLKDKKMVPPSLNPIGYWFGYLNSACNPIIYALRSPAFREGYKEIMCQTQAVITSEETDAYETTAGPFSRLRAFLRQSMRYTTTNRNSASYSGSAQPSRHPSLSSLTNMLLRPYVKRTLSTSSLPGSFKYRAGEAPKVSVIGGKAVLTLGGKIICYKTLDNNGDKPKRISSPPAMSDLPEFKIGETIESPDDDENRTILTNEQVPNGHVTQGNHVIPVMQTDISGSYLSTKDAAGSDSLSPSILGSSSSGRADVGRLSFEDEVFVLGADSDVEQVTFRFDDKPKIKVTSDEDETIYQDDGSDVVAKRQQYGRSMSEHQAEEDQNEADEDLSVSRPRSHSEVFIKKKEPKGVFKSNFITKIFTRSKQKLASYSSSGKESDIGRNRSDSRVSNLTVPGVNGNRDYLRSQSDDATKRRIISESEASSAAILDDNMYKAASDTVITSDDTLRRHKKNHEQYKKSKDLNVSFELDVQSDEALDISRDQKLKRSASEKPRLHRYPSIEKLDKRRKYHSKKRRSKKGEHWKQDSDKRNFKGSLKAIFGKHETVTDKFEKRKESTYTIITNLDTNMSEGLTMPRQQRSVSDPCVTFDMIEDKVARRTATKKWKKDSGKKPMYCDAICGRNPSKGFLPDDTPKLTPANHPTYQYSNGETFVPEMAIVPLGKNRVCPNAQNHTAKPKCKLSSPVLKRLLLGKRKKENVPNPSKSLNDLDQTEMGNAQSVSDMDNETKVPSEFYSNPQTHSEQFLDKMDNLRFTSLNMHYKSPETRYELESEV